MITLFAYKATVDPARAEKVRLRTMIHLSSEDKQLKEVMNFLSLSIQANST